MPARPGLFLAVLILAPGITFGQSEAESLSASIRKAAKLAGPATVTIRGFGGVAPLPPTAGTGPFPGRDGVPDVGGSGVIIDSTKGYVLTNDHVVPDLPKIVVILADGRRKTVKDVRRDPRSDLALLVIDPEGLAQAEWGDSEALEIADWVVAIGQPFGLAGTVTAGIVSGPRRAFTPQGYDDLIQTSAAINAGSSGGPLVDLKGRILGINVAIKTLNGGYEGVGFAVPASRARRIATDLAEFGTVRRAYLGLATDPADPDNGKPAPVVSSIVLHSPAETAGLRVGDAIVSIAGRPTHSPGAVRLAAEFATIGQSITMTILRDGKPLDVTIVPVAIPEEPGPRRR